MSKPKPGQFDFIAARRRLGELEMSQAALAAKLGCNRSQVSRWLAGAQQPSVSRRALANALRSTQGALWVPTETEAALVALAELVASMRGESS